MRRDEPGSEAACLYGGRVMHARLRPFGHRFAYRVFSLLIDLDRLAEADRLSALFSVGRFNLLSFQARDHGARNDTDLRSQVDALLAAEGVFIPGGRVQLLCYPRVLGFVFNPLAVYYCRDAEGVLRAVVYEVRNTFGGLHAYVRPVRAQDWNGVELRQAQDKSFYVSPFLDMDMRYHFRQRPPADSFSLRILETDPTGPVFCAAMKGRRRALTTGTVLSACAAVPLLTLKVIAAIHWQALKLWLKGAKYHPDPHAPALVPERQKA